MRERDHSSVTLWDQKEARQSHLLLGVMTKMMRKKPPSFGKAAAGIAERVAIAWSSNRSSSLPNGISQGWEETDMKVKWFALGIVATLIVLSAAAYIYSQKGFASTRADVKPGTMDSWLGSAMDASTRRQAPKMMNPVSDTPDALLAAGKVYGSRCAVCHGTPNDKDSKLGASLNPPAPQFFGDEPPDMMENENYYIIKHGVRMTGMPAWGNLLSDQQIWQTVDLLKHINDKNLPQPVVEQLAQAQNSRD